jgi:hypothetical protein
MGTIFKSPAPLQPQCNRTIFLAGGISNCADWQEGVAVRIAAEVPDCVIYNPRRDDFDMSAYEEVSRQQIIWEFHALRMSTVNLFWFPAETLCPITLFEYGSAIERLHAGAVMCGTHPDYQRRFDLIEQTRLRNGMPIFDDLDHLVSETIILLKSIPA